MWKTLIEPVAAGREQGIYLCEYANQSLGPGIGLTVDLFSHWADSTIDGQRQLLSQKVTEFRDEDPLQPLVKAQGIDGKRLAALQCLMTGGLLFPPCLRPHLAFQRRQRCSQLVAHGPPTDNVSVYPCTRAD